MLPEQEALYTIHNAPKRLTKPRVIRTQLEESLVACVMCDYVPWLPSSPLFSESYTLRIHPYILLIYRRCYSHFVLP